jgi:hypothetical protein
VGADPADPSLTDNLCWARNLGVEFRWVPEGLFRRHSYLAQALHRLCYEHQADVVLLVDADTLVAAPFNDAVELAVRTQSLGGCIAHAPPFPVRSKIDWDTLFRHFGLPRPRLRHLYAGWPLMFKRRGVEQLCPQLCPAYFNFGVLLFPRAIARRVGDHIFSALEKVNALQDSYFNGQLALAMTIAELDIPYHCLPFRYNAANWSALQKLYPCEVDQARILHLISGKGDVFKDWESIQAYMGRADLVGINRRAQDILKAIYSTVLAHGRP